MSAIEERRRSRRLELRTTPGERDLIDRAVAVTDTGLTEFVVTNAVEAARRVLADRDHFELDAEALAAWESINDRRARDLPGSAGSWSARRRSSSDGGLPGTRAAR